MVDVVVVEENERVREIPSREVDVGPDHVRGINDVASVAGMSLAPCAERAKINQFDQRMTVEAASGFVEESFEILKEDRVTVVGFEASARESVTACAFLENVFRRRKRDGSVAFVGHEPHGKAVVVLAPLVDDLVDVRPVVYALFLFDVAPVEAEVEVVQPREPFEVIFGIVSDAVIVAEVTVVDVMPVPALVRVAQDPAVVLKFAQIAEVRRCGTAVEQGETDRVRGFRFGLAADVRIIVHGNSPLLQFFVHPEKQFVIVFTGSILFQLLSVPPDTAAVEVVSALHVQTLCRAVAAVTADRKADFIGYFCRFRFQCIEQTGRDAAVVDMEEDAQVGDQRHSGERTFLCRMDQRNVTGNFSFIFRNKRSAAASLFREIILIGFKIRMPSVREVGVVDRPCILFGHSADGDFIIGIIDHMTIPSSFCVIFFRCSSGRRA